MGNVYLAMHVGPAGTSKLLVVKELRSDLALIPDARSMFLDEARLSMRLNHPNIVQTIEVVDDDEGLYLVMEFLDGQPLSRILEPKHGGMFPLRTKLHVLADALEGLHYAHDLADYDGTPLGIVHRDVSPHNVFVTYDGHVKLVDFGVAKAAGATTVTESGVFKGKVRYAAPEQALCGDVDRRADVFAMGTILWEILAGRRMWEGRADAVILASLATAQVPSLRAVRPDVAPQLEAICVKALSHVPDGRFSTALELRDALLEYEHSLPSERTLANAVLSAFAVERRGLHALIDTQSKATRHVSEDRQTMREIPLIPMAPSSGALPLSEDASASRAVTSALKPAVIPPQPRRRPWWIAGSAAAALTVVGAVALGARSHAGRDAEPAPSSSASTPPPVASIHLTLRASPSSARFVLDGTPLTGNPYEADVPRDDAPHRLSIQADGFEPRTMDARFTRDVSVDVALGPSEAPVGAAQSAVPASSAVPVVAPVIASPPARRAPVSTRRAGPGAPTRGIDEEDPYKP